MTCQPGRIHQNMRPNWVGPTPLIMEIAPSLGSPDPQYLQEYNYSDLCELGCNLAQDELRSPWQQSVWRTRN